ncbi:MAG: NUDIX domain-containing protein [Bacteroidetes bacterium]|nr:NUDIX domain-containing protein [Bacteroidota bacterium]
MDYVVLVDSNDVEVGVMEKMEAHRKGILHRAFSVLIYNSKGKLLLQNVLHISTIPVVYGPIPAAVTRLPERICLLRQTGDSEEMGIKGIQLTVENSMIYKTDFENGLMEHELDYILKGISDADPVMNPNEAEDFRWMAIADLKSDVNLFPEKYTFWLKEMIRKNIL